MWPGSPEHRTHAAEVAAADAAELARLRAARDELANLCDTYDSNAMDNVFVGKAGWVPTGMIRRALDL